MPDDAEAACGELSTVLWRERDLLDGLAFTLEVQRLVLASDDPRWLSRACRAVEVTLERLRAAELVRAVRVDVLAAELGLAPAPSLRALAEVVDEPWSDLLRRHHDAMVGAAREIDCLAARNHRGLAQHRELSDCPPAATPEDGTVATPDGPSVGTPDGPSVATPDGPSVGTSDRWSMASEDAGARDGRRW